MGMFTAVYDHVLLEFPFSLSRLLWIEINQSFNHHGVAVIKGWLEESTDLDVIYSMNEKTNLKIKIKEKESEKILFSGIPMNVEIKQLSQQKEIKIVLYSYSILLDFKEKRRSFQNKDNLIRTLLKTVITEAGGDAMGLASNGMVQNEPMIQYDETDWEFVKRVASHVGVGIYPFVQGESPQIYLGIHGGADDKEESYEYGIKKAITEYLLFQSKGQSVLETDFITYQVESLKSYELGDKIQYKKITFVVVKKRSTYDFGVWKHTYTLQKETGTGVVKYNNEKLKGVSIEGTVLEVEGDKLKVHFGIDESQKVGEAFWFSFLTPYSTEGSTGWYAMPEKGSQVLVHMQTGEEKEGYVKEVTRKDGAENPKTQNPEWNYFETAEGKGMKASSGEFTFYSVEDTLHLKLDSSLGVEIKSPEEIKLSTEKGIKGQCETISMEAKDRIILKTKKTSIVMDDIIQIKG